MGYNISLPVLIILIYLPIFLLSLTSKQFKEKFMKVHSKTLKEYSIEMLVGITYFIIIIVSLFTDVLQNDISLILGLSIYVISLTITYTGYLVFSRTSDKILIKSFPYNISRNPTYFFGLISILGIVIMTMSNLLIILLMIQFLLTHKIILTEEKYLGKKYGKVYVKYMKDVRRYF